jgi:hypothetical protein
MTQPNNLDTTLNHKTHNIINITEAKLASHQANTKPSNTKQKRNADLNPTTSKPNTTTAHT